jgi:quinoprotein dehydrogenase-associated probable ABC transporter substrate-binding protein
MARSNPAACRPSSSGHGAVLQRRAFVGLRIACIALAAQMASAEQADSVLRVCADPNNMPLSNQGGEGYENKIAQDLARDLGRRIEYTYFPQRMGFVRNTLRQKDAQTQQFKCDVIIGVPKGYELTATTRPYMHSTYALVFAWREDLADVHTAEGLLKLPPATLRALRIGVFGRSPGADWLLRNDMLDHAVVYSPQSGDPAETPAHVIEQDLASGKIDMAIVWGPIAGFLVRRHAALPAWQAAPFMPDSEIKFDYEISMGVRFGEKEWKDTLDQWISGHQDQVEDILASYRVPLLDANGKLIAADQVEEQTRAGAVRKDIPLQLETER